MTQTQDDFEQLVDTLTAKLHQMTVREAALCERNYTLVRRIGDLENENNALKALVDGRNSGADDADLADEPPVAGQP